MNPALRHVERAIETGRESTRPEGYEWRQQRRRWGCRIVFGRGRGATTAEHPYKGRELVSDLREGTEINPVPDNVPCHGDTKPQEECCRALLGGDLPDAVEAILVPAKVLPGLEPHIFDIL